MLNCLFKITEKLYLQHLTTTKFHEIVLEQKPVEIIYIIFPQPRTFFVTDSFPLFAPNESTRYSPRVLCPESILK
jgi:hypothetical protein